MKKFLFFIPALALFFIVWPTYAQATFTASEVLERVKKESDKVHDYTADISAAVNIPGVKIPPMKARIFFKKPDKIHIESDGFAMIPKDIVSVRPDMFTNSDMFDAVVQGMETVEGVQCVKVKLLAKSDTARIQRATILVDPGKWIILKMITDPSEGASAEAILTYSRIENKYYLPSKIQLVMNGAMMRRRKNNMKKDEPEHKDKGEVRLVYTNYRVNKGISDSVFKKK